MRFVTLAGRRVNTEAIVEIREEMNPQYQIDLAFYMYHCPLVTERSADGAVISTFRHDEPPKFTEYPDGVTVELNNGDSIFVEDKTKEEVEEMISDG